MRSLYRGLVIIIMAVTLPVVGHADDGVTRASGGSIVCGYFFDNNHDFSNWHVQNVNSGSDLRIEGITFYDAFGNLDFAFPSIPPGHYGVVKGGVLGARQSDVYRSGDITDFSGWGTGLEFPKTGQVLIEWSATTPADILPLGAKLIRTKKTYNRFGKTIAVARTSDVCRTVSLEYAE